MQTYQNESPEKLNEDQKRLLKQLPVLEAVSKELEEVKKAVEAYWAGKLSAEDLNKAAAEVKKASWTTVKAQGVDFIPRYLP